MRQKIDIYTDGATVRLRNKRISFQEADNKTSIKFEFADSEADKPACFHRCIKGKVRETKIQISIEAMEALVFSYLKYKQERARAAFIQQKTML